METPAIDKGLALLRLRIEREQKVKLREASPPPPPPPPLPSEEAQSEAPRFTGFSGLASLARQQAQETSRAAPPLAQPFCHSNQLLTKSPKALAPRSSCLNASRSVPVVPIKKLRLRIVRRLGKQRLSEIVFNRRLALSAFSIWKGLKYHSVK